MMFNYIVISVGVGIRGSVTSVANEESIEWVSGVADDRMSWDVLNNNQIVYHQARLASMQPFVEKNGLIEDLTVFFATPYVGSANIFPSRTLSYSYADTRNSHQGWTRSR